MHTPAQEKLLALKTTLYNEIEMKRYYNNAFRIDILHYSFSSDLYIQTVNHPIILINAEKSENS